METTIAGITAVESKDVNTSKGVGTLFLVKDSVGVEYSTFTKELAVQAVALIGQNATIGFDVKTTVKPNRDGVDTTYTNRYLKSLAAAGEQAFVSTPAPVAPVASQSVTEASSGILLPKGSAYTPDPKIVTQQDREASIARAVALKAAIDSIDGLNLDGLESILITAEEYRGWLQGELSIPPMAGSARALALATDDIPF